MTLVFQVLFVVWMGIELQYEQFSYAALLFMAVFAYMQYLKPNALLFLSNLSSGFVFFLYFSFFILKSTGLNDWEFVAAFFFPSSIAIYLLLGWTFLLLHKSLYSEQFHKIYRRLYYTGMVLFLYVFTFWEPLSEFIELLSTTNDKLRISAIAIGSFWGLAAAIFYFVFKKRIKLDDNYKIALGFCLLCFFMLFLGKEFAVVAFIAVHLAYLSFSSWAIYEGIQKQHKGSFMIGVFLLITWAAGRYFVLIDNYIVTALLLFLSAVLVYGMNLLWNRRILKNNK
jgi:hypothetical protein